MDAKQIARGLGALSIEERVQIIQSLLEAGPDGLMMLDIAARTGLGGSAVFKQLETLVDLEIVLVRPVGNNKTYSVNAAPLNQLIGWLYDHFGPGFHAARDAAQGGVRMPASS